MPDAGLKTWAKKANPKAQQASMAAKMALMHLPVSQTKHGVAVPFPFRDREEFKQFHSNKELNQRITNAPVVDMPTEGLNAIQHSVKPKTVAWYIDNPERQEGRVHPKTGIPNDLPIVIQQNGIRYIFDGHHRATAAALKGEKSIQVRFVNFDDDAPKPPGSVSQSASASANTASTSSSSS